MNYLNLYDIMISDIFEFYRKSQVNNYEKANFWKGTRCF